ncbi:hypothetical protein MKW94_007188 [Papaver nudicaule]|uniref:BTB domain-containing protein n=1 Tax=Papaver nudicaule TaxID=74823 RepID=A0AA41VL64_PAPNU|nr:hypothetical protein [Papaver nudicaule]
MEQREGWIGFHSDLEGAFREELYSDIAVKPGCGPPIRAHKFMLATRSEILCKAAPEESISLPEFDHEELETFLEFLYRGDLAREQFEKHFCSLLIAADKYEIPHLQKFSEQQLLRMLNPSNALSILEISDIVLNETLRNAALKLIVLQYKEIVLTASFEEFAKQKPQLVVQITKAALTYASMKRII